MPDITKCLTDTCVKKMTCYRWTSPADLLQSYSGFEPKDCKYYIEDLHKVPKNGTGRKINLYTSKASAEVA